MCMCVCVYVCVCVCVDCEAGWTLYSQDYEYLNGTTQLKATSETASEAAKTQVSRVLGR